MANNPKVLDNLKPYKKGQSGNPKGRPKKYITTLKDSGYKLSEINDTIQALIALNMEELKLVWEDSNATVLEKTIASSIKKGIDKGTLDSIETLIDRVYGKPKTILDMTENTVKAIEIIIKK